MKLKKVGKDAEPAAEGTSTPSARTKGAGNNLIPAAVIALGLMGGGFFMGGNGGGGDVAAAQPPPAAHAADNGNGPVQALEPITLNLADGRFLKVGIALQMAASEEEGGEESGDEEVAAAKALDVAISLLGSYTMDELADPKERELVKKELSELVAEAYADPDTKAPVVTKVYFTEFVMQ